MTYLAFFWCREARFQGINLPHQASPFSKAHRGGLRSSRAPDRVERCFLSAVWPSRDPFGARVGRKGSGRTRRNPPRGVGASSRKPGVGPLTKTRRVPQQPREKSVRGRQGCGAGYPVLRTGDARSGQTPLWPALSTAAPREQLCHTGCHSSACGLKPGQPRARTRTHTQVHILAHPSEPGRAAFHFISFLVTGAGRSAS